MKTKYLITAICLLTIAIFSGCSSKKSDQSKSLSSDINNSTDTTVLALDYASRQSGGDILNEICCKYAFDFYGLDGILDEYIGSDKITEWIEAEKPEEITTYQIIKYFNIPKDVFIDLYQGVQYSNEQIDAMYSNDIMRINKAFANEYALVVNGEIFTPDWLATHTKSDYVNNGITAEMLIEYVNKIDIQELEFACIPIAITLCEMDNTFNMKNVKQFKNKTYIRSMYVIPDEIHGVILDSDYEKWANEFKIANNKDARDINEMNLYNLINDLNISKENVSIITQDSFNEKQQVAILSKDLSKVKETLNINNIINDFSLTSKSKNYDMEWLSTHDILDYQEVGITTVDLKSLLAQITEYNYTSQYEWIDSCLNRMIEDIS